MPTVGPTLPPHLLAKRKRADEGIDGESSSTSSSVSSTTPSPESDTKRRRVIGPAPPPAPLEEQPAEPPSDVEGSSEDDGYGPTLPHEDAKDDHKIPEVYSTSAFITTPQEDRAGSKKTQRDEWMMMPPKQDELQARMDPTKIRARKFNTSKNAKGPNESRDGESSVWTETPEQKRQRLQDQVMGVSTSASGGNTSQSQTVARSKARDEQNKQRIREHNVGSDSIHFSTPEATLTAT